MVILLKLFVILYGYFYNCDMKFIQSKQEAVV